MGERREWAILLSCWLIYLFHLGPVPGVNENRYLDQVRSLVEEQRLDIDRYHYNTVDKALAGGHYYPTAAPGPSLLAVPAYLVFKLVTWPFSLRVMKQYDVARYLRQDMGGRDTPDDFIARYPFAEFVLCHLFLTATVCGLLSAATAVMVYQTLGVMTPHAPYRVAIPLLYAFGTLMFFYATRFYAHAPSTFFAFTAFLLLLAVKQGRLGRPYVLWAGFANGSAILMDYVALPTAVVVGLYGMFVTTKRDRWRFVVGTGLPVLGLLGYQYRCFGHPLAMPQTFMTGANRAVFAERFGLALPDPVILWKLLFSLYRGMFLYMPILLCAIYALVRLLLDRTHPYRAEWWVIGGVITLQLLFNSTMKTIWNGGYTFGPRYLVTALPFLMIPLGEAWRWMSMRLVIGAGVLSVLINWAGVQYIVSQNPVGSIGMFLVSGPTSQMYQFIRSYLQTYSQWALSISPLGGFFVLGVALWGIWRVVDRQPCGQEVVKTVG